MIAGRELLVLRHAKSRWDQPDTGDHDRDLAPRGVIAAERMGRLMADRGWLPDRILCSTARRAMRTLELTRAEWPGEGAAIPTAYEAGLYHAAPATMLEILRAQPDAAMRVLVVGHNPGLEMFVQRLVGGGDRAALAALAEKYPTGALARLRAPATGWRELGWGGAELADFIQPRGLPPEA